MKEFKTYDNTILQVGKKYRWSGFSEGLYVDTSWSNMKCKIRKIEEDKIYIYDYDDGKEWAFTNEQLKKKQVTFKKMFFAKLLSMI